MQHPFWMPQIYPSLYPLLVSLVSFCYGAEFHNIGNVCAIRLFMLCQVCGEKMDWVEKALLLIDPDVGRRGQADGIPRDPVRTTL